MRFSSFFGSGLAVIAPLAVLLGACGGTVEEKKVPLVAVLSAFPAELNPLVEQATIDGTVAIDGRIFRIGVLRGVPVVLGLTGIGLFNATATTRAALDRFEVTGVVVSGVAGSSLRIGDVSTPLRWRFASGAAYPADPKWIEAATETAASGAVALERCTTVAAATPKTEVCLPHDPAIVVGGTGQSDDSAGDRPFPCQPGGGDIFGCDIHPIGGTASDRSPFAAAAAGSEAPIVTDMETAAIAREAAERGIPFIAFRAVSDGAGDPLGLPGYPAQFFAYYRLAASNAAAAALAFIERLAEAPGAGMGQRQLP